MKIPNKLKIGGHTYTVEQKSELENMGETHYKKCKILIDSTMSQSNKEATLIHEAFHVMNTTLGGSQMSHALLDSLSEQMYQFLSENKLLK
jgi:hypothetical protein